MGPGAIALYNFHGSHSLQTLPPELMYVRSWKSQAPQGSPIEALRRFKNSLTTIKAY